ncbi:hypothetical protein EGW08_011995, partial [Elysia chlorotica]
KESVCGKYSSCRWVLAYLCFLARFMQTALRQSLGIAIIGMTMKVTERVVTPDAGLEAWEADNARNNSALHGNNNIGSSGSLAGPVFLNLVQNGSTVRWTDENGHNWTMEGLFASLPFMGRIVSGIAAAVVSDWMLRVGVSTATTRKTFQALGNWSCGLCTLLLAFIPMSAATSMGFLVLALTMQNLTSVAYKINLLDIAPRYAGLLNGVMSTVSTLASLPAPVITSLLIADGSREGWRAVFCMVAGLTTFGGLIFIVFAQGEIQDWAVMPVSSTPVDLDPEADPAPSGARSSRKRRRSGYGEMDPSDLYVPESCLFGVQSGGPVRGVQSLPPTSHGVAGSKPKQKLRRSATVEVGAFVRRVRSQAFSNLPFSDFP